MTTPPATSSKARPSARAAQPSRATEGAQAGLGVGAGVGSGGLSIDDAVLLQQQILMVRQSITIGVVSFFNASVLAGFYYNHAAMGPWLALAWYLGAVLCSASLVGGWLKVRGRALPTRPSRLVMSRAKLGITVIGAWWGASVLFIYPPNDVGLQLLMLLILTGSAAGVVSLLNPIPALVQRFAIVMMGPQIVRLCVDVDPLSATVAVLTVVYGLAMLRGARTAERSLVEMVRQSQAAMTARRTLDNALEATSDAFAVFDASGARVIANARHLDWFGADDRADAYKDNSISQLSTGAWLMTTVRTTTDGGLVVTHVDVTTLKEREAELDRARQEAEAADRAKSQFLANMSHELRTPLNAVIGFSQLMSREIYGPMGDPRYRSHIDDVHASGEHLLAIINDILDMAKLESADYELIESDVNVGEAVEWAARMARGRHGAARSAPKLDLPSDVLVRADEQALKQVLVNLIANALKFTPANRCAGVTVRALPDEGVSIVVWDEGVGIPADRMETITRPFTQVENVVRKQYEGAGLGLALALSLVELHGGKLLIESLENAGTTVEVQLPPARTIGSVAAAKADAAAAAQRADKMRPAAASPQASAADADDDWVFEDVAPSAAPARGPQSLPKTLMDKLDDETRRDPTHLAPVAVAPPPDTRDTPEQPERDADDALIFEDIDGCELAELAPSAAPRPGAEAAVSAGAGLGVEADPAAPSAQQVALRVSRAR